MSLLDPANNLGNNPPSEDHIHNIPTPTPPKHNTLSLAVAAAAAKKLNCNPDPDSIAAAIDILTNGVEELRTKVAFYESLFGYPSEYLMAFHEDELKNYHNVILMGQQKLEGKTLQKSYREKTGKTLSLQALAGKSVIEEVKESHYGFAVVLSMQAKERLDRKIRKVREAEAKEKAKAKAEGEAKRMAAPEGLAGVENTPEQGHAGASIAPDSMISDPQVAPVGDEQKRKRAIVVADEEDEDQNDDHKRMRRSD